jgi:glycosyltransferase involved in cell wall biosynthesis
MASPAVSVVIPTFNRGVLLRKALDSLQRQSFRDFETLVVDDGSTEDISAAVGDHPIRPKIIRQDRRGPAAARNRGVSAAAAGMIAFLDSDDEWLPEKLQRFLAAAERSPEIKIWYGPMRPVDSDGREVPGRTKTCQAGRITSALFESSFVHVPTVVCDRSVMEDFGGFDEGLSVCEDYDLWLRVSTRYAFGLVPEALALRRLHADRLSKSCMRRNLVIKADMLERFYLEPAYGSHLDSRRARPRISSVMLAAARAALRDRYYADAAAMARRSREYGASLPRRLAIEWPARVMSRLNGERIHLDHTSRAEGERPLHAPPTIVSVHSRPERQ